MDEAPEGPTLLVGEGDFSFSVAMTTRLPLTYHRSILATSFETPESIKKHLPAEENMAALTKTGVDVRLSTDATQLHTDPYFQGKRFARIIFNFPHTGGKSNLKRNRKLLNDFFASASQILEPEGHIMVTLCKGQGGTPADQPMRKWHDSWQVVSMAANSGFILVRVWPFQRDRYTVYTSTGFRSQDKGFHTDNALTHVFERAEMVSIPSTVEDVVVKVDEGVFSCPTYIHYKLEQIRRIKADLHHPTNYLYKNIVSKLREHIASERLFEGNQTICDDGFQKCMLIPCSKQSNIEVSDISKSDNGVYKLNLCDRVESEIEEYNDVLMTVRQKSEEACCKIYDLASSLTTGLELDSDMVSENSCVASYGVVFKRACFANKTTPASLNALITWPVSDDIVNKCDGSPLKYITKSVSSTDQGALSENSSFMENIIQGSVRQVSRMVEVLQSIFCDSDEGFGLCFTKKDPRIHENVQSAMHAFGNIVYTSINGIQEMEDVGKVCLVELSHSKWRITVEFNLGKLTCLIFKIPSEKYLWSNDARVKGELDRLVTLQGNDSLTEIMDEHKSFEDEAKLNNDSVVDQVKDNNATPTMENDVTKSSSLGNNTNLISDAVIHQVMDNNSRLSINNIGNLGASMTIDTEGRSTEMNNVMQKLHLNHASNNFFVAPSVFPLTTVHDMSFWENSSFPFDEQTFFDIIRSMVRDDIGSVELIDIFTEPSSSRKSCCYRLTFVSVDKCLPYDCSWKLQSLIRLEVERLMKITLR